jgi:hypothetical protein
VALTSPPRVQALRAADGSALWQGALKAAPTTGPVAMGRFVAVGTKAGVQVLAVGSGRTAWSGDCGEVAGRLAVDESALVAVTASRELVVHSWDGKERVRRRKDLAEGISPAQCGDCVLVFEGGNLASIDIPSGGAFSVVLPAMAWLGRVRTPLVVLDSHLYFATEKKGLVCIKPWR